MDRELHVTSPPMNGPDVAELQAKLNSIGYLPGKVDGTYGPTTAGAVRVAQRRYGLNVDGVVGPATQAALATAMADPVRSAPSVIGLAALAEARKHIGVKEAPPTSNMTMFGAWFGVNGVPWCNIFVSYCFRVGAGYTIAADYPRSAPGIYPLGCSYVPTTEDWLQGAGMWLGRVPPLSGDIAIYKWNHAVEPHHIGIVESYDGDGMFHAIEGNAVDGPGSNEGEVLRALRSMVDVDGFGRV